MEAPTGGSIRSVSGSEVWEKMGLRGDPKPGLVLRLRESGVKGGSICKNPWLSPEEGAGVLERGDDAQHARHHGTQTQTQPQQEKEHSPEQRPREQRDDLREGQEHKAGALLNLQRSKVPAPPPLKAQAAGPRPCSPGKGFCLLRLHCGSYITHISLRD